MRNFMVNKFVVALVVVASATLTATAQLRPYATDAQVRAVLTRIESKTDVFQTRLNAALNRRNTVSVMDRQAIQSYVDDFESATDRLRNRVDSRATIYSEVEDVLTRAAYIDQFMRRYTLTPAAENQWTSLRTDLNTLARYYRVSWNWNRTLPPYPGAGTGTFPTTPVNQNQVRALLTRIETKTNNFTTRMNRIQDRDRWTGNDDIFEYIRGFEEATDDLRSRFNSGSSTSNEVNEVLTRASYIDQFMARNTLPAVAENQWSSLKTDLNQLAGLYNVGYWDWNRQLPPWSRYPGTGTGFPVGGLDNRITGTYRLNRSASDNVSAIVNRSVTVFPANRRETVRRNLERRLGSPEMIAIEMRNRNVTLASSLSPQASVELDGVARSETNPNGRVIRTSATTDSDGFTITTTGDRVNDFFVDFASLPNGQLRVTRRLYLEGRNEQITVNSVYDKIDNVARWSEVNTGGGIWDGGTTAGEFYIPNGTQLTAVLRNMVSTRASQVGDRFALEVTGPAQYRGAIIEGRITDEDSSGRVTGRASMSFDFDTIRLPNGQTYRFAGLIDSVRTPDGDNVSVTNEGTVRDGSQTTRTVTRAGIGAAIGAIIGAITGGGQGAAIGAAVGAGAGAGTVLIQGRDNVELNQGTVFNITASAPANVVGFNR